MANKQENRTIKLAAAPASQTLPEGDLLRIMDGDLTDSQREAVRRYLLDAIQGPLAGMGIYELQHVAQFVTLRKESNGNCTPMESFVVDLVSSSRYPDFTPEKVDLDTLRLDFADCIEISRRFSAKHPELVAERKPGAEAQCA
ncbi:MAG: hypothetical protein ABSH56_11860 [Bryobacteraceae bacterium]|jgi:hypothetical protein